MNFKFAPFVDIKNLFESYYFSTCEIKDDGKIPTSCKGRRVTNCSSEASSRIYTAITFQLLLAAEHDLATASQNAPHVSATRRLRYYRISESIDSAAHAHARTRVIQPINTSRCLIIDDGIAVKRNRASILPRPRLNFSVSRGLLFSYIAPSARDEEKTREKRKGDECRGSPGDGEAKRRKIIARTPLYPA